MHKVVLAALICCVLNTSAKVYSTGNDLKGLCDSPALSPEWFVCGVYIQGVLDAHRGRPPAFCEPERGLSASEKITLFRDFVSKHPEKGSLLGAEIILELMTNEFPCPE
jgi:Rap1a immunity proteins